MRSPALGSKEIVRETSSSSASPIATPPKGNMMGLVYVPEKVVCPETVRVGAVFEDESNVVSTSLMGCPALILYNIA
jgi:hypothetical protein